MMNKEYTGGGGALKYIVAHIVVFMIFVSLSELILLAITKKKNVHSASALN